MFLVRSYRAGAIEVLLFDFAVDVHLPPSVADVGIHFLPVDSVDVFGVGVFD